MVNLFMKRFSSGVNSVYVYPTTLYTAYKAEQYILNTFSQSKTNPPPDYKQGGGSEFLKLTKQQVNDIKYLIQEFVQTTQELS